MLRGLVFDRRYLKIWPALNVGEVHQNATGLFDNLIDRFSSCYPRHSVFFQLELRPRNRSWLASGEFASSPPPSCFRLLFICHSAVYPNAGELKLRVQDAVVTKLEILEPAQQPPRLLGPIGAKKKSITATSEPETTSSDEHSQIHHIQNLSQFLEDIGTQDTSAPGLVDGPQVKYQISVERSLIPEEQGFCVSLGDILTSSIAKYQFNRSRRLYVGAIITSSVIQLCGTPWLKQDCLKADEIYFRQEGDQIQFKKPYLFQEMKPSRTNVFFGSFVDRSSDWLRINCDTANKLIFALGILLIELWTGEMFPSLHRNDEWNNYDSLKDDPDGVSRQIALSKADILEKESGFDYANMIRKCVAPLLDFKRLEKNAISFQETVYTEVLCPLQRYLSTFLDSTQGVKDKEPPLKQSAISGNSSAIVADNVLEIFFDLIIQENCLGRLFKEAFEMKEGPERFKANILSLLNYYIKGLRPYVRGEVEMEIIRVIFNGIDLVAQRLHNFYGKVAPEERTQQDQEKDLIEEGGVMPLCGYNHHNVLICRPPFIDLRLGLRKLVAHKPMEAIKYEILCGYHKFSPRKYTAKFEIASEIGAYINKELDESQNLSSVLTISGNARNAYATTYAQYAAWQWPNIDIKLITSLGATMKDRKNHCLKLNSQIINISPSGNGYILNTEGDLNSLTEIAQEIVWLSTACRPPSSGKLGLSKFRFINMEPRTFSLDLRDLEDVKLTRENLCWNTLFKGTVIAEGFPIPQRNGQVVGIELPFQMMVNLSRISYAAIYDNKVVLSGFSTMLFPTAIEPIPGEQDSISTADALEASDKTWIEISDAALLQEARTFLGFCRKANIHLGTKSNYADIDYSSLQNCRPNLGVSIHSMGIGSSRIGFFGVMPTVETRYPSSSKEMRANIKQDNFDDIISWMRLQPTILYDSSNQRAWLVSMISVTLHMVHKWIERNAQNVKLPYAHPTWNGTQEAYNILTQNRNLELRRSSGTAKPYRLRDLVKRLWAFLHACDNGRPGTGRRPSLNTEGGHPRVFGWEFMDIVEARATAYLEMRQETLNNGGCGWDLLTRDVLVLTFQNLADVILPAASLACERCQGNEVAGNRALSLQNMPVGSVLDRTSSETAIMNVLGDVARFPSACVGD
ncbi:MAG: hypothetical protein M1834_007038 [Cirrosporium novae-zelandiae]|nr:MAG: hypothetical protein M1834_007038 [Cirrosporium novae-zelandiae]